MTNGGVGLRTVLAVTYDNAGERLPFEERVQIHGEPVAGQPLRLELPLIVA